MPRTRILLASVTSAVQLWRSYLTKNLRGEYDAPNFEVSSCAVAALAKQGGYGVEVEAFEPRAEIPSVAEGAWTPHFPLLRWRILLFCPPQPKPKSHSSALPKASVIT